MVRPEVQNVVSLGRLPSERAITDDATERVEAFERALTAIMAPVSDDEAVALADCFGEDLCFGLAWTLRYLIETAPSARVAAPPAVRAWRARLAEL